jgi:hypothetical protein
VNPHGIDNAGTPARFTDIVNISDRYIESGSEDLSPNLKAGVGEVGVNMQSHPLSKTCSKSFFMSVRTFCALR